MSDWEVSLVRDTAMRIVVANKLSVEQIPEAIAEAWRRAADLEARSPTLRRYGVAVTRSDWTREARREKWESQFYDITRSGARRRRYKKPAIEAQWEQWVKDQRKVEREARARNNAGRGSGR